MNAFMMTDEQILELGFEALVDKLGPVGMIRFIHQFEAGTGDYTEERQQWLGMSDVETFAKQVQQAENNTEYMVEAFSPVAEKELDSTGVYSLPVKALLDLQVEESSKPGLAAEDIEVSSTAPFRIESQIQGFAASISD
jgi:hypothetical protein